MKKSAAIWILILVMLIWGSSYAVTKSTLQEVPPSMLAFIRFLIASAAMLPFYLQSSHKTSRPSTKDYYLMGWMGFSGITGYFLLFNYALLYTSASSGALIQGSMPLCIALLGALLLKEKLRKLQITGIICSFAGVVLVAWTGGDQSGEKKYASWQYAHVCICTLLDRLYLAVSKNQASESAEDHFPEYLRRYSVVIPIRPG